MAESFAARLSLDEIRTSVKRMQTEGRKLVTRLRKDATALVNRRPLDVLADARKRATKAVQELDAQRHRVRTLVFERLASLTDEAVARAGLAKAQDVSELKRRVHDLERRIERVTKAA
jgi:ubiquinone biosynthesis protein UbiJ